MVQVVLEIVVLWKTPQVAVLDIKQVFKASPPGCHHFNLIMLADKNLKEMGFSHDIIQHARVMAKQTQRDILEVAIELNDKVKELKGKEQNLRLDCIYHEDYGELLKETQTMRVAGVPVGLKNVSNCCYLNSLLQSYFFCPQLFRAIVNFRKPSAKQLQGLPGFSSQIKLRKANAACNLVQQIKALFLGMACSDRAYLNPQKVMNFLVDEKGNRFKQEKDLCQINMLLLSSIEQALGYSQLIMYGQSKTSLIRQLYFVERTEFKGSQLSQNVLSLGFIVNTGSGSLERSLREQQFYKIQLQGAQVQKQSWIKRTPNLLFIHIQRVFFQNKTFLKTVSPFAYPIDLSLDSYLLQNRQQYLETKEILNHLRGQQAQLQDKLAFVQNYLISYQRLRSMQNELPIQTAELPQQNQLIQWRKANVDKLKALKSQISRLSVDKNQHLFKLKAVYVHEGKKAQFGHYWVNISFKDEWFRLNDTKVIKTSLKTVLQQSSGDGLTCAYALLYQRVHSSTINLQPNFQLKSHIKKSGTFDLMDKATYYEDLFWPKDVQSFTKENHQLGQKLQKCKQYMQAVSVCQDYETRFQWVNEKVRLANSKNNLFFFTQNYAIYLRSLSSQPNPVLKFHLLDNCVQRSFGKSLTQLKATPIHSLLTSILSMRLSKFIVPEQFSLEGSIVNQVSQTLKSFKQNVIGQRAALILLREEHDIQTLLTVSRIAKNHISTQFRRISTDSATILILRQICKFYQNNQAGLSFNVQQLHQIFAVISFGIEESLVEKQIRKILSQMNLANINQKFMVFFQDLIKAAYSAPTQQLLQALKEEKLSRAAELLDVEQTLTKRRDHWQCQSSQFQEVRQQVKSFGNRNRKWIQLNYRLSKQGKPLQISEILCQQATW